MTAPTAEFAVDEMSDERRRRRRQRLYVFLQTGGWLSLLVMHLLFARYFTPAADRPPPLNQAAAATRIMLLGLLLTHFGRHFMQRWGWKSLDWVALVPRGLLAALVLSGVWNLIGFALEYGLLQQPWKSQFPMSAIFVASVVNGFILMLGWLCLYFCYHAIERYRRSEIERLRLQAAVKEAELRALKAQVNPHFMFNALNSVRALIDEDPARARQAVTQLANLLRYALRSGAMETVAFEEELTVVNDYLALEQVRHEERLRLRVDVMPEVLQQPVPTMLLQTLVENAVKYGVSTRPEGGEVGIRAWRAGARLHLQVTNPGRLQRLQQAHRTDGSTGLGLRNASERLRLLFGETAQLKLVQAGDDVVAEVSLPFDSDAQRRDRPVRRERVARAPLVP